MAVHSKMANAIKPKSTSTVSKVATSGDLLTGELGCNIADGVLFLKKSDNSIAIFSPASGTVTSVAMTVPTGLSISGTPITTSGTLALTLTAGYSIPTTSNQTNWDSAYTNKISSLTVTGSSGSATLSSNILNIPTYTLAGLGGQNSSASLTSLAGLTFASTSFVKMTAAGTFGLDTSTYLTGNQSVTLSGDVTGSGTTAITATLATVTVAKGGTGLTTLTSNNVVLGNGTSTPSFVAPSTSGNLLTSNGTTWQSTAPAAQMPTGALMPYAGASAPTGYLLCDGSSVSSSSYLALHAVISNTYGGSAYTGAGALSFNLPDLRGRLPMGAGTGTGLNASGTGAPSGTAQTARTRGQWLGEETHALLTAEMPSHSHNGATGNAGSHSHTPAGSIGNDGISTRNLAVGGGSQWGFTSTATITNTVADHSHTIPANGGDGRHAIIPPCVVLNYIIKT
jgi:microcystin-dependent protein